MEQIHPLVRDYHDAILGFDAPAFAKMNAPDSVRKYTKIYRRLSYRLIQSHLRGDMTLAVCLINTAGSARAAVLDIDNGGEEALQRVLKQAEARSLVAFAQTSQNAEHDGGHVWLLFDIWGEPERFRLLADTLAYDAGVSAETYPTRKSIRLPLGVHRWTGQRGRLIIPSHLPLELDAGEHNVREAVRIIRSLPRNDAEQLPVRPTPIAIPIQKIASRRSEHPQRHQDTIRDYNHSIDLRAFLERLGGRVAQFLPSGSILMHCPCPHHKHQDARPSIELRQAKNTERYGEFVVYGYAPGCSFFTERGQIMDAFNVYCKFYGLETDEAIQQITAM